MKIHWQLIHDVWERNQNNLLGYSIHAALFKNSLGAIKQLENTLIEDYKKRPELVRESIGIDLKPYLQ